ncbi:MAG: hypothetical protein RIR43_316, partial [Pseudomonadota bacterium]
QQGGQPRQKSFLLRINPEVWVEMNAWPPKNAEAAMPR